MFLSLFHDFLFRSLKRSIVEGEGGGGGGAGTATDDEEADLEPKPEPEAEPGEGDGDDEVVTVKGKQYKASELLGADGIPRAKNLQVELERKNRELKEKDDLLKGIVSQQPQTQAVDPQRQFNNIVEAVKQKYPDESESSIRMAVEISQGMVNAMQIAREPIDAEYFTDRAKTSVKEKSDRTVLEKWEDEVNEALSQMPTAWRRTPQNAAIAVKNAIDVVKGRHIDDIIADAKKGIDSRGNIRPRDTGPISGGGAKVPKGPENHGTGLTEAQKNDLSNMSNISESEYKGLLKKAQERDKALKRPVRQTLNG